MRNALVLFSAVLLAAASTPALGDYRCQWIGDSESGSRSKTSFLLKDKAEKEDSAGNARIKIEILGKKSVLSYSERRGEAEPRLLYRVECDSSLNCNAYKMNSTKSREEIAPLSVAPGGSTVSILNKERELFRYSLRYKGFRYQYIQYRDSANQPVGFEVSCEEH